jgi:hypothetical protein
MHPAMEIFKPIFQTVRILAPPHAIYSRGCVPLQGVVTVPQQIYRQMVQQGREPFLLPLPRHSAHAA